MARSGWLHLLIFGIKAFNGFEAKEEKVWRAPKGVKVPITNGIKELVMHLRCTDSDWWL